MYRRNLFDDELHKLEDTAARMLRRIAPPPSRLNNNNNNNNNNPNNIRSNSVSSRPATARGSAAPPGAFSPGYRAPQQFQRSASAGVGMGSSSSSPVASPSFQQHNTSVTSQASTAINTIDQKFTRDEHFQQIRDSARSHPSRRHVVPAHLQATTSDPSTAGQQQQLSSRPCASALTTGRPIRKKVKKPKRTRSSNNQQHQSAGGAGGKRAISPYHVASDIHSGKRFARVSREDTAKTSAAAVPALVAGRKRKSADQLQDEQRGGAAADNTAAAAAPSPGVGLDSSLFPDVSEIAVHSPATMASSATPRHQQPSSGSNNNNNTARRSASSSSVVPEIGIPRRYSHVYNQRDGCDSVLARCLRSGWKFSDVPTAASATTTSENDHDDHHRHHRAEENARSISIASSARSASVGTNAVLPPPGSVIQCFIEDPPPCTFAASGGRKSARSQLNFLLPTPDGAADATKDMSLGVSPRPPQQQQHLSPNHQNNNSNNNSGPSSYSRSSSAQQQQQQQHLGGSNSRSRSRSPLEVQHEEMSSILLAQHSAAIAGPSPSSSSAATCAPKVITSPRYDRVANLFPSTGELYRQHRPLIETAEAVLRFTPDAFAQMYQNVFCSNDTDLFRLPEFVLGALVSSSGEEEEERGEGANGEADGGGNHPFTTPRGRGGGARSSSAGADDENVVVLSPMREGEDDRDEEDDEDKDDIILTPDSPEMRDAIEAVTSSSSPSSAIVKGNNNAPVATTTTTTISEEVVRSACAAFVQQTLVKGETESRCAIYHEMTRALQQAENFYQNLNVGGAVGNKKKSINKKTTTAAARSPSSVPTAATKNSGETKKPRRRSLVKLQQDLNATRELAEEVLAAKREASKQCNAAQLTFLNVFFAAAKRADPLRDPDPVFSERILIDENNTAHNVTASDDDHDDDDDDHHHHHHHHQRSPRLLRLLELNNMHPHRYVLLSTTWSALWCCAVALDLPCVAAFRRFDHDIVVPRRPSLHELQSEFFGGAEVSEITYARMAQHDTKPKECTVGTKVIAATVGFGKSKGLHRAHAVRLDTALQHTARWLADGIKLQQQQEARLRHYDNNNNSNVHEDATDLHHRSVSARSAVSSSGGDDAGDGGIKNLESVLDGLQSFSDSEMQTMMIAVSILRWAWQFRESSVRAL